MQQLTPAKQQCQAARATVNPKPHRLLALRIGRHQKMSNEPLFLQLFKAAKLAILH
jgi:hypothetical protein